MKMVGHYDKFVKQISAAIAVTEKSSAQQCLAISGI